MGGGVLLALLLTLGAVAMLFIPRKAAAMETENAPTGDNLDELFSDAGRVYGVDPLLLKAIAIVESNLDPEAVRNNPPHDVSVGLMQVLCLPDDQGFCTNRFNVDGWRGMTFDALKDPTTNIKIAAQILAWNLRQFGTPRGIAVYNSWSARNSPLEGPFPNGGYVTKVLNNYRKLKGA